MNLRDFKLIRSRRRTLALQVRPGGELIVRAPVFMCEPDIHRFVREKQSWIEKTAARLKECTEKFPKVRLDKKERRRHQEDVFMTLTLRCQFFAERMRVRYHSLALSNARTRWGSCTFDGRLRFNWRLALVPAEILDYVAVHELAHLKEQNHSPKFWAVVESACPEWKAAKRWLKDNQERLNAVL